MVSFNRFILKRFIETEKRRLRGAINGTSNPVNLTELSDQGKFHKKFFYSNLESLMSERHAFGTVVSHWFIPSAFAQRRETFIAENFQQSISLKLLDSLKISNPREYLKARFKSGLLLETLFIQNTVLDQFIGKPDGILWPNPLLTDILICF